jgi:hypothetical protein
MLKQDSFVEHLNQETVNDDQQDATTSVYLFIPNQLYVFSGDVFAHHQEHLTVFTASGIIHHYCCWLVSWMRWKFHLIHDTGRQQYRWSILDAVNTVKSS